MRVASHRESGPRCAELANVSAVCREGEVVRFGRLRSPRKKSRAREAWAPRARVPSVPRSRWWPQAWRQGVVPCQSPVCDRDLASPLDTKLVPESVGVGLRGPRGDSERCADLVVRATCGDELDHLTLALCDRRGSVDQGAVHGVDANTGQVHQPLAERCISLRTPKYRRLTRELQRPSR